VGGRLLHRHSQPAHQRVGHQRFRYGETEDVSFSLSYWHDEVRIEVADGTPGRPQVKRPTADEESGRGMLIVEALAEDWGTSEDGALTWCTIAVPEPVLPKSGFWCEWHQEDGKQLALTAMPTPDHAIRWARVQMRVTASAIDASLAGHIWDWLSDGWHEPAEALKNGEEFTLPLSAGPYKFLWHARPVRFVPVVGGSPLPHLAEDGPESDRQVPLSARAREPIDHHRFDFGTRSEVLSFHAHSERFVLRSIEELQTRRRHR
jgi:hypothetical protein